jgi:sialic acid synthase SpsE
LKKTKKEIVIFTKEHKSFKNRYHLKNEIKSGHIIGFNDLIMKRPGNGISPMQIDEVIGKKVVRDLNEEHMLAFNDLMN